MACLRRCSASARLKLSRNAPCAGSSPGVCAPCARWSAAARRRSGWRCGSATGSTPATSPGRSRHLRRRRHDRRQCRARAAARRAEHLLRLAARRIEARPILARRHLLRGKGRPPTPYRHAETEHLRPGAFQRPAEPIRYGTQEPAKARRPSDRRRFRKIPLPPRRMAFASLFRAELSAAWSMRWLISTSRRTPDFVADAVAEMAKDGSSRRSLYRFPRRGSRHAASDLRGAEIMVCTSDSSSMLSEAIAVHLPVIGLLPAAHGFKPQEASTVA